MTAPRTGRPEPKTTQHAERAPNSTTTNPTGRDPTPTPRGQRASALHERPHTRTAITARHHETPPAPPPVHPTSRPNIPGNAIAAVFLTRIGRKAPRPPFRPLPPTLRALGNAPTCDNAGRDAEEWARGLPADSGQKFRPAPWSPWEFALFFGRGVPGSVPCTLQSVDFFDQVSERTPHGGQGGQHGGPPVPGLAALVGQRPAFACAQPRHSGSELVTGVHRVPPSAPGPSDRFSWSARVRIISVRVR